MFCVSESYLFQVQIMSRMTDWFISFKNYWFMTFGPSARYTWSLGFRSCSCVVQSYLGGLMYLDGTGFQSLD